MLDRAIKARNIINAMIPESEDLQQYSISAKDWNIAVKLCTLLLLFHDATVTQSGSHYVSLSMTARVYEMQTDAVDDFTEVESDILRAIGMSMKEILESYKDLVNSKLVRVSRILDPRFQKTCRR